MTTATLVWLALACEGAATDSGTPTGTVVGCTDLDEDGACAEDDCDDRDPGRSPTEAEVWYDGVDQDCDGRDDDQDADGYFIADDCNDRDGEVNPGAAEVWYDGIDQDCDGNDTDQDGDGWPLSGDCDDTNPALNPDAVEVWYDGVDQDCDGNDTDQDGDGYDVGQDCDDLDAGRSPGTAEVWYDGVDQDCDGNDTDQDGDGFEVKADCDDRDADVYPGNEETWYDGKDGDCLGDDDYDRDGDGFQIEAVGGQDCDDSAPLVNPLQPEVLGDAVDQDCNGADDLGEWLLDPLTGHSLLEGVRLGETSEGVLVSVLCGSTSSGTPGTYWQFLDPLAPWGGAISLGGWSFTTTLTLMSGFDLLTDGDHAVESLMFDDGTDQTWYVTTTDTVTYSYGGEQVYSSGLRDFEDFQLVAYGGEIHACATETTDDWVLYLGGTRAEFTLGRTPAFLQNGLSTKGGVACISRPDLGEVWATVPSSSELLAYDTVNTTGMGQVFGGPATSTETWEDMDVVYDGTTPTLVTAVTGGGLEVQQGSTSVTVATTTPPARVQVAIDGTDVFVAVVDTADHAWLYYGDVSSGFRELDLSTGFASDQDADVWVASSGELVVAVLGDGDLLTMGLRR